MRPKKIRAEKVMHTRKGWKHTDDMKRLRIIGECCSGGYCFHCSGRCGYMDDATGEFAKRSGNSSVKSRTDFGAVLPVYDDSFNLVLVNKNRQLKSDFSVQLTEFRGVQIRRADSSCTGKMLEDAKT